MSISVETTSDLTDRGRGLAPGRLRFLGSTAISVGIQGPTGGIVFLPAAMAGLVGASGPLAFLLAVVAMLPVAYAFGMFSTEFNSAGSAYKFNGTALGPSFGFLSCWMLLIVYVLYAGSTIAATTNELQPLLHQVSLNITWQIPAAVVSAIMFFLAYRSIRLSALVVLALEGVSLLLVLIVGLVVVAKGGFGGHSVSLSPFKSHGLGFSALTLGLVFAFTGFSGFEGAATVGEETRLPRKVIPAAIFASLVIGGGAYVFGSWISTIAFPSSDALAKQSVPFVTLTHQFVTPWMGTVINIAAVISSFGACLACVAAASRLLFALGRDGFISRRLGETHPVYRSPAKAVCVVAVVAIAAMYILSFKPPIDDFAYLATWGADLIIAVYAFTVISALVYLVRRRRRPLGMLISVVGIAVLGVVIKDTVHPVPVFPYNILLYLAGSIIVIGLIILAVFPGYRRRLRSSPLFNAHLSYEDAPALTGTDGAEPALAGPIGL